MYIYHISGNLFITVYDKVGYCSGGQTAAVILRLTLGEPSSIMHLITAEGKHRKGECIGKGTEAVNRERLLVV